MSASNRGSVRTAAGAGEAATADGPRAEPRYTAATSSLAFLAANFIEEPRGHMVEVDEHGNVQMIAVE